MSGLESLIANASSAFARRFGRGPEWGGAAPGRVNLIGEHTDYNQGFVLPMAIDRWCVCVGAPAAGARSRLVAHDLDAAVEVSLRDARTQGPAARESLPGWARYIVGSLVEHADTLELGPIEELDLLAASTVPRGGGLSSSAAIETASATLLESSTGRSCRALARALACQRAEHRWAGVPCGLMDQLASSFGVAGQALLIDCRDNAVRPVPMPPADEAVVLVVDSGVRHDLAAGEYAKRRAACESAAGALGVTSLRGIERVGAVDWSLLDEEQGRCVRHVVSENGRVLAGVDALRAGDLAGFGRLMRESHASLRDDYHVSCVELDAIIELATATPGVFGARMTGGGFGGCAVVLAAPEGAGRLCAGLPGAYRTRTGVGCRVERVCAVAGAVAIPRVRR